MDDKDNVRVDLLKFRRKAYLSYPEGSQERKTFLKTILQNELRLTNQDIPHDLINFLVEGDKIVLSDTIKQIILCTFAVILSTTSAFLLHSSYHGIVSSIFGMLAVGCLWAAIQYGHDYWRYRKSVDTVKQYSNDMKQYMNRISNDIKRLDGPHGF